MRNEILDIWREPTAVLTMDELIRSNKELEQFAFTASHDLQEPLKVISLYLQLFNRKYKGRLDDKADEAICSVLERTDRMQKLIQSTLDYSRAGQADVQFVTLDSGAVLKQAIENLKVTIDENSAQISYEGCPVIKGDEIRLTQVFQNLISNAIKFRKKDEPCSIHISVKQDNNQWLFSVEDKGIGIETKYIESIFDIFRRLHAHSEYAGNGIGLALCKKIITAHHGNIWIESEIGQGSIVYFTLPRNFPAASSTRIRLV